MKESEMESVDYSDCEGQDQFLDYDDQKNKFKFISNLFSSKKKNQRMQRGKSPYIIRQRVSPHRQGRKMVFAFTEDEETYQTEEEIVGDLQNDRREGPQYKVMYIDTSRGNQLEHHFEHKSCSPGIEKSAKEEEKLFEDMRKNKTYIEVVRVEDRGTSPCKSQEVIENKIEIVDKGSDAIYLTECDLPSCEKEKRGLSIDLQNKEKSIKRSLDEGDLLYEDIEKIKKHLSSSGQFPDAISKYIKVERDTPSELIHLSRQCMMELSKQLLSATKQADADVQKLKAELQAVKKEKSEKESTILSLERKIESQVNRISQEGKDSFELQCKIGKIHDAYKAKEKIFREVEKSFKTKIELFESDLAAQKQLNSELTKTLEEKTLRINQLEGEIQNLQESLEVTKQQVKDIHFAYKSKISKLETENSTKLANICENQTLTNKQLSQALDQSSTYANQLQELKNENAELQSACKRLEERVALAEREMSKAQERSMVAERKLGRETQEVLTLRSQLDRLERLGEEELLTVDGDTWCQIMYQNDQWILQDLRDSLKEKENNLESLRAQGNCALKDFEYAQNELQQRRQQFNELQDVFYDFQKKRETVVREQRDFYAKIMFLSRKTIPRDKFFKNLIEECQTKTNRIEELEKTVANTNKLVEETKKISEAQLQAMQGEMKFTAEKLYEFENQIRIKEMQLQDVIKVFEQEKKHKVSAEEAMNTYKILLEDSKKENSELRNRLNYIEDLERNKTSALRTAEELAVEIKRRQDTEQKLKELEKDLVEMKHHLQPKGDCSPRQNNSGSLKEIEQLRMRIQDLMENKKYMERILMESHRSKEMLKSDHEELYNKMRHAVRVMVESKRAQETLEMKLDQRMLTIEKLQESQAETEDRLDDLKDVLHEMKQTIAVLNQEREELRDQLNNHVHCQAERAIHQELKSLQRDKAVAEDQCSREKEMLLQRIRGHEETINEQHKHLLAFQEQMEVLNGQLREIKGQLAAERHSHTQQMLNLQAEKKKMELYIQELEGRLTFETRLRMKNSGTLVSTANPKYLTSSDSYEPPMRDHNRHHYQRK